MENEKVICFDKDDFTEEQWEIICEEFEADTNAEYLMCAVDLSTVSHKRK